MNDSIATQRFIREALPLLSSFLYSESVELDAIELDVSDDDVEDDFTAFARMLRMRHAISCGMRLKPILEAIERGFSQTSEVVRSESKGTIDGRLDISLYLQRRGTNFSWPRTFPILIVEASANTPENQLVVDTLRQLVRRLSEADVEQISAEQAYCLSLLRWGREKLHSQPWARIRLSRNTERLCRETDHRLRKRQTGNEAAYRRFMEWHKQWQFDTSRSDPEQIEDFVSQLFAFPPGDFFEDRVFEIWCLQQLIDSFRRCGAVIVNGPRLLSERSKRPVCEMKYEQYSFDIWFQRAMPATAAKWKYIHSGKPMGGIPDITVIGCDGRRLLIDGKRRVVRGQTRAEESYKMLGYLENFRSLFDTAGFWGALCFLSEDDLFTEIVTNENRHKLVLVGAHTFDPAICAFGGRMDTFVSEWLDRRSAISTLETMEISGMPI